MSSEFKILPGHHPELRHWHGNVGEAVAVDLAGPLVRGVKGIDVLSWNVAIGAARLEDVVTKLQAGWFDGEVRRINRPLVILVQEAFRADDSVPERALTKHTGGKSPRQRRYDIVEAAHALGMSLRYAPSMRNGVHRSDRGNAILSTVSVAHARAFPLPHARQRRVAVAVELQGLPWLTLVTAHLDTRGRIQGKSGRMVQASELARHLDSEWGTDQTIVVGADLNSYFGARERMFAGFQRAGFQRLALERRPRHTFHARGLRMLLDHVLVRNAEQSIAAVKVLRLDESEDDRGRFIFGSDHHPLLARLEFAPRHRRTKRT
jgi:endonuclease/exonuclease/phosphatase family metal-dependent hydrolase